MVLLKRQSPSGLGTIRFVFGDHQIRNIIGCLLYFGMSSGFPEEPRVCHSLSWIRIAIAALRDHFGIPSGLGKSFWRLPEALRFFYFLYGASPTEDNEELRSDPNVLFRTTRFVGTLGKKGACKTLLNFKKYIDKL